MRKSSFRSLTPIPVRCSVMSYKCREYNKISKTLSDYVTLTVSNTKISVPELNKHAFIRDLRRISTRKNNPQVLNFTIKEQESPLSYWFPLKEEARQCVDRISELYKEINK